MNSAEELYSAEQINIPITFPDILKLYVKSAIRTQPYDLLTWTAAYFRALANDEVPPVKERFDHPPFTHPTGLTPSYLRILFNQFGRPSYGSCIALKALFQRWQAMALTDLLLYRILKIGHLLHNEIDLYRFLAVACGLLGNNLVDTMIHICELLTCEPVGGSAMIPHQILVNLYGYLANLDGTGQTPAETSEIGSVEGTTDSPSSGDILSRDSGSIYTCQDESCSEAGGHSKVTHGWASIKTLGDDRGLENCAHSAGETDEMSTEVLGNDDRSILDDDVVKLQEDTQRLPLSDYNSSVHSPDKSSLQEGSGGEVAVYLSEDDYGGEFYGEYSHEIEERRVTKALIIGVNGSSINEDLQTLEKLKSNLIPENIEGICECMEAGKKCACSGKSSEQDENFVRTFTQRIEEKYSPMHIDYNVPGIGAIVSVERVTAIQVWLMDCSRRQQGWIGPRNLRHFMCPKLFDEYDSSENCDDCECDQ
ncbi:uncharacterized protein LOC135161258 [Diachasmimorpha longicaudata]|uniref:uncharacterized protein LOC135161258 n=1 Tax=Diachasmimorpha longicaudata TaxID=58733 RepID=UPI0030B8C06E